MLAWNPKDEVDAIACPGCGAIQDCTPDCPVDNRRDLDGPHDTMCDDYPEGGE